MSTTLKQLLLVAAIVAVAAPRVLIAAQPGSEKSALVHGHNHYNQHPDVMQRMADLAPMTRSDGYDAPYPGAKPKFVLKKGDSELTIDGRIKIEHYFDRNANLLNKRIPDEQEYFKNTFDLAFDYAYGKDKYGYKAVEMYTDLRHKGVWGRGLSFADRDGGPIGPSLIKFNSSEEASFGAHSHNSGKLLIWFKEAWLAFSPNAAVGSCSSDYLHLIKLGWFPFEMGRGIALGAAYGLNKELLGLYSYVEDKAAPGINLNGILAKDVLSYDLYFGRFEERNKSLSDAISLNKTQLVDKGPIRGINKDDDVVAGRLKWKAFNNECWGELSVEPYIFYNAASDQRIEVAPDSEINWGSYGLGLEYAAGPFECGAEAAFNYGKQKAYALDRNQIKVITNDDGFVVEQYSHVLVGSADSKAPKALFTTANAGVVNVRTGAVNGQPIPGSATLYSASDRFRPAYTNKLDGWMAVTDVAYTFEAIALKLAFAYGYASGDADPNFEEKNKTYHGFIGLHEFYNGKRVKSILFLDERSIARPSTLNKTVGTRADQDTSFSDLQHVGMGLTWAPKCMIKGLSINPNVLGFWKAHESDKFDVATGKLSTEKARGYLGTELNLLTRATVIKDLTLFANFAFFIPGGYYTDMKGLSAGNDFIADVLDEDGNEIEQPERFRLGDDSAYHMNIGLDFKF